MQSLDNQNAIKSLKLVLSLMGISGRSPLVLPFSALLRKYELVAKSLLVLMFAKISLWTKKVQT